MLLVIIILFKIFLNLIKFVRSPRSFKIVRTAQILIVRLKKVLKNCFEASIAVALPHL